MTDKTAQLKEVTRKVADLLPRPCAHPQHNPPQHMVYAPGVSVRLFNVGRTTL